MRTLLPTRVLPFAVCAAAAAQSPLPLIHDDGTPIAPVHRQDRDLPSALPHAGFRRALPARLTGHVVPDVLVLDGGTLLLAVAPDIHSTVVPLPGLGPHATVHDCAPMRTTAMDPMQPLALVGPGGLRVWRMAPGVAAPIVTGVPDSAWQGASRVVAHPDDGTVLFGLGADGQTLLSIACADGTCSGPTMTATIGEDVVALACIDWNRDGASDVGVLTAGVLQVYDRNGRMMTQEAFEDPLASDDLQLVRWLDGAGRTIDEWLCLITGVGMQSVLVRNETLSADVPLGPTAYVALAAGDLTLDDKEELLLSTAANAEVTVLLNLAGGHPEVFAHHPAVAVRIEVADPDPTGTSACGVAVADLDGDFDGDLLAPIEPNGTRGAFLSLVRPRFQAQTPLADFDQPHFLDPIDLLDPVLAASIEAGKLRFEFAIAAVPGASHYEVAIWREELSGQLAPTAVQRLWFEEEGMPLDRRCWVEVDRGHIDAGGTYVAMLRPLVVTGTTIEMAGVAALGRLHRPTFLADPDPVRGGVVVGGIGTVRPLPLPPSPAPTPPTPGTN
ncbi:MAG: hypothetical protein AB7O97_14195 [Planctomycetota bacterium]